MVICSRWVPSLAIAPALLLALAASAVAGQTSYEYDNLNRLTKVSFADGSFTRYNYDSDGNRIAEVTVAAGGTDFDLRLSTSRTQITGPDLVVVTSTVLGQSAVCDASTAPATGWVGKGLPLLAGQVNLSGPVEVTATTTFTLSCVSSVTQTRLTRTARVSLIPPSFDASLILSKTQINGPDVVFLTSSVVAQAANCVARSPVDWNGKFFMAANTSATSGAVNVNATTTFELQCTSTGGVTVTRWATVTRN